jgi:hypothetical protein
MYGWLPDSPGDTLEDYKIDRAKFPTRYQEYAFALDHLGSPGFLIDAGTGFNPEIHNFPYMAEKRGWTVIATDANPKTLEMPASEKITRYVEDMCLGWFTKGLDADVWTCISTLEHLAPLQQIMALEVAYNSLRPGGLAILTADFISPQRLASLLRYAGFDPGEEIQNIPLNPRVSCAVAYRL